MRRNKLIELIREEIREDRATEKIRGLQVAISTAGQRSNLVVKDEVMSTTDDLGRLLHKPNRKQYSGLGGVIRDPLTLSDYYQFDWPSMAEQQLSDAKGQLARQSEELEDVKGQLAAQRDKVRVMTQHMEGSDKYYFAPPNDSAQREVTRLKDVGIKSLERQIAELKTQLAAISKNPDAEYGLLLRIAELKEKVKRRDGHIENLHTQRSTQDAVHDRALSRLVAGEDLHKAQTNKIRFLEGQVAALEALRVAGDEIVNTLQRRLQHPSYTLAPKPLMPDDIKALIKALQNWDGLVWNPIGQKGCIRLATDEIKSHYEEKTA